jgi:hypothetical protein
MESFRRNPSEWNLSERIFQKESFRRNYSEMSFLAKLESFRMESFRRNLSESILTGIFQNGIFQKLFWESNSEGKMDN